MKYSAEEIKQAAVINRYVLLNDDKAWDAFLDSIVCGLREAPAEPGLRVVAESVARSIIGGEE